MQDLEAEGKNEDTKLISRMTITYYVIGIFAFYAWYQVTMDALSGGKVLVFDDIAFSIISFLQGFVHVSILFVVNTYIVFVLGKRFKPKFKFIIELALSQFASVCVSLMFIAIVFMFGKRPMVDWVQTMMIDFMIFMINEMMWAIYNNKRKQEIYEKTRRLAVQLQYNVLRAQVNPHFLFDSLNILYSLVHLDVERSKKFIMSLSKMYRYIMLHRDEMTVTLKGELEFLDTYVDILKILYYDCFDVEISKRENTGHKHIVPYSLQLLIENVIKHNVIDTNNPMKVHVEITEDTLTVCNKINAKNNKAKTEDNTGIGLRYLEELYKLQGHQIIIKDNESYFNITVPLINK